MLSLARLRFEVQPLATGDEEAAGASDAVGEQHEREDRDARGNEWGVGQEGRRRDGDDQVYQDERWRADRHDRPHCNSGRHGHRSGGKRRHEFIVRDGVAKPCPKQARSCEINAEKAERRVRAKLKTLLRHQEGGCPGIQTDDEQSGKEGIHQQGAVMQLLRQQGVSGGDE